MEHKHKHYTVDYKQQLLLLLLLLLPPRPFPPLWQDRVLADRIQSDGRACVVVCNKWDLVEDKNDASYNKVRRVVPRHPSVAKKSLRWRYVVDICVPRPSRTEAVFFVLSRSRVSSECPMMVLRGFLCSSAAVKLPQACLHPAESYGILSTFLG